MSGWVSCHLYESVEVQQGWSSKEDGCVLLERALCVQCVGLNCTELYCDCTLLPDQVKSRPHPRQSIHRIAVGMIEYSPLFPHAAVQPQFRSRSSADVAELLTFAKGPRLTPSSQSESQTAGSDAVTSEDQILPPGSTEADFTSVCSATNLTPESLSVLYRVVCGNAFALQTPLFGVEYGAAFFKAAARINHSCNPNCLSIRLGGNMAVFACQAITPGDEITHSYELPHVLCT